METQGWTLFVREHSLYNIKAHKKRKETEHHKDVVFGTQH